MLTRSLGMAVVLLVACGRPPVIRHEAVATHRDSKDGQAVSGGGPSRAESPAALLGGLSSWHLTLPTGPSDSATQIERPELLTYTDAYFAVAASGDAVRLVALFGGARTSTKTAFARCELRQEYRGADALSHKSWACGSSVHTMHVKERIVATPLHKPEMSVAQIHDADNDLLEVLYLGPEDASGVGTGDGTSDTGRIEARFNDGATSEVLDDAYRLGDSMSVDIATDGSGNMSVAYSNLASKKTQAASRAFYDAVAGGCYFKAGNYHQACTKLDINGKANAACAAKNWPPERFETEPAGQSELELLELQAK